MNIQQLREQLCEKAMKMEQMGLVAGTAGNISIRIPNSELVLITPSSIPYGEYTPDMMCVVDMDGNLVEGDLQPSSETPLHTMIHKRLVGDHAIVHTHSPYATTFAVLGMPIPVLGLEGLGFGAGQILPTDSFVTPGSPELGDSVIAAFDKQPGSNAVLLQNHGVVALGSAIPDALNLANSVELTARIYYQALCIGKPQVLTGEQVTRQLKFYADLKESFKAKHPGK